MTSAKIRRSLLFASGVIASLAVTTARAANSPTTQPQHLAVDSTVKVFGGPNDYAGFPSLVRTESQLFLTFDTQPLDKLREAKITHPHYGPVTKHMWAISNDGGKGWTTTDVPPKWDGPIIATASPGFAALPDGGLMSLRWTYEKGTTTRLPFVEQIFRGSFAEPPAVSRRESTFDPVVTHGIYRTPGNDGFLVTAYHGSTTKQAGGINVYRGNASGEDWKQIGFVQSQPPFNFNESGMTLYPDGRAVLVMRNDWDKKQANGTTQPAESNGNGNERGGYGYWLYQSDSTDFGHTWSMPRQLPIWGHPPFLLQLKSGNLLMVYGHRRAPFSVRAILSHDQGRTWDLNSMVTIQTFDPAHYDIGYPVAAQLDDGRIIVPYYGYTSSDIKVMDSPHGIFVATLRESK